MTHKVVIVGGAGFLGCALSRRLKAAGQEVVVADTLARLQRTQLAAEGFATKVVDFPVLDGIESLLDGVETLLHLACRTNPANSATVPGNAVRDDVLGSVALFEAAIAAGVKRIIFSSSGGTVYGAPTGLPVSEAASTTPISPYGISKLAIEGYLRFFARTHGVTGISLRIANPYGDYQIDSDLPIGIMARYIKRFLAGEVLEVWGDGTIVRDYIHVDDVAEAVAKALACEGLASGEYNIGTGRAVSITDLIDLLGRLGGREPTVTFQPARGFDVPAIVLDSQRFTEATGWRPTVTLHQGMESMFMSARRQAIEPQSIGLKKS